MSESLKADREKRFGDAAKIIADLYIEGHNRKALDLLAILDGSDRMAMAFLVSEQFDKTLRGRWSDTMLAWNGE